MEKKTKIWIICALVLSAFTTTINITESRWISVGLALIGMIGLGDLFIKKEIKGFYLTCACYGLSFLYSTINSLSETNALVYIIMAFIGSMIIPGITWLFISKDKELKIR
ncbi:MAG: hypothetical protein MR210_04680 [Erysipelotrichaceae bacterium]|nr:hypothetical protein [Erysipelotrichaceae bacterium]MDY5251680.1 hypothetical protein [Erysipelotrichaceae bacterium]